MRPGRITRRPDPDRSRRPISRGEASATEDRASRDLKEEISHAVPRPPGCRTSTRLGARTDHPEAGIARTTEP